MTDAIPSLEAAHGLPLEDLHEVVDALTPAVVHRFANKRVLITGGRGFLGRWFTAVFDAMNRGPLRDTPVEVVAMDSGIVGGGAFPMNAPPHITHVKHNIIHSYHLPAREHVDFVLACAGIASPYYYRKFPLETLDVTVTGLRNTLGIARSHGARMVFFGSSEEYGDPPASAVPTREDYRGNVDSMGARAVYDESKRLGSTLCKVYASTFDTQVCVVRPFNVFGPGMTRHDYRVLPNFAAAITDGRPLQVYGSGKQTRTYCYVTDALQGFLRALVHGKPGEAYNIGTDTPELSVAALALRMAAAAAKVDPALAVSSTPTAYPASYPADEPNRRCPDITKARAQLDYVPRMELDNGLFRFLQWSIPRFKER